MVNLPESRAYTLHFRNKPRFHLPCIMNLRLSRVFPLLSLAFTLGKGFKPEIKVHILQQYILISQGRNSRYYEAAYNIMLALYPQTCSCHCWKMKTNIFSWRNNLLKSQHYHRPAWENQQDQQGERVSGYKTSEEPALEHKDKNY